MSDLIELSAADLDMVSGGAAKAHHLHGVGQKRETGVTQINNDVTVQLALAINIDSPGAVAIAGNNATSLQGNFIL